mmetsp:Transcript_43480/g.107532  ORF Transcript_43480/g.107532 Transcript_43480/m.107532 type:complete len:361 (-) Transcript_43480:24-1106(-)
MVLLHLNCLLVGTASVFEVIEAGEGDGEVHVARGKVGLEVDRRGEEVEGARVLPRVEVHQPEVVRDDPLERVEVERALEAGDGGNVALLAEEAHADVVPELSRVGRRHRRHAVLDQRNVHVGVVLDDRARREDGLGVLRVVRQRVSQEVEGTVVLAQAEVEQPHRREHLRVVGREVECLEVHLDCGAEVLLQRVHLAKLHVGGVVLLNRVGLLEAVDRLFVLLQVHLAQPLVVPHLPVLFVEPHRLLVDVERSLVLAEQVERAADLLEVVDVVWVEAGRCLEELQRVLDLATLPLDQRLDVDRVLAQPVVEFELLLDQHQAPVVVLLHVVHVDEPVGALPQRARLQVSAGCGAGRSHIVE